MYRFETIEEDLFKLVYIKNGETKEIPFKRNIDIASRMDGVNSNANKKLMLELTKEGLTASDFTIKRTTEDGKIIYDNTNWIEFKSVDKIFEKFNNKTKHTSQYSERKVKKLENSIVLKDITYQYEKDNEEKVLFNKENQILEKAEKIFYN